MKQVGYVVECEEQYKWILRNSSKFNPESQYMDDMIGADLGKEKVVLDFIRSKSEMFPVFIDIGAHVGYYTVRCAEFYKKVYAFEPNTTIEPCLRANIALNGIRNVIVLSIALSDEERNDELFTRGGCGHLKKLGNLGEEKFPGISRLEASVPVVVRRMDNVLPSIDLPFVAKVDTEGSDLDVLKGATGMFGTPSVWVVEHHQDVYMLEGRKQAIIDFMLSHKMNLIEEFFKESPGDNKLVFSNCL